ncbi:NAD(P)H-dependent nitrite reductase catalytic subunit [Rhodopseudomonas thermotolerans]|uniref:NAD(P)H-dependent nitrite reductase catalytic subunit n=2 Tax=Rhodopseudomonas TaxID=1073 RepID=A0A336JV39_9BRAD|nr:MULTISPECIES: NirA family protein [Rhodopseudomonas]RED21419.1 NAD(P)H-dependent nitrite reductase catalytic subunit [Rhodopseudomonas pentothenatexigens]REF86906.1 NAD(P)H-dependent nitrite reductase catalytic subunit [Rhodopseudomonas thermotolerans]SSW93697.1 NAD(P)H-dependent nitrite reductase catalytic subunit [Rhodopseudomonas pentothenatexigens]
MGSEFSVDQKRYLEGFATGVTAARAARGSLPAGGAAPPSGPDAIHLAAQDRVTAAGKKLNDQEKWKREQHPFEAYVRLKQQARDNAAPKPPDNFRWRYYGLFYVAPAQTSYMCRLRIPNGILSSWQMAGLADLADILAGGYAHVTTRANLQMREIAPKDAVKLLQGIESLGLWARGSGADNIRNVTGSATAGIDPQELIDTRPYARDWHFHILNERALFGLPRKFNVAFDGGGLIPTLEDTNDIAFQAVQIADGHGVAPGVYFRLALGGITGHRDFARDTGVIVAAEEATEVADAIVRVFIEHGDRTDRNKARLKYVLDAFGFDKYLELVEDKLGRKLIRVPAEAAAPRPAQDRTAHLGVHRQQQAGLNWIGVRLATGHLTSAQMRGLAEIARSFGDGDLRLTVWQNLLISGVPDARVADASAAIETLGLAITASPLRAGLVACTGASGCRFAAAHTKETAEAIAQHCEPRVALDSPINIHLTGCHNSCAQHFISDIGLIGAKVAISDEDSVEGFHIHVGGGFGSEAAIGTEVLRDVKQDDAPRVIEHMLQTYLAHRTSPAESFLAFVRRHDAAALQHLFAFEQSPETVA